MSSKFHLIDTLTCGLNELLSPRTGAPTFSSLYNYYDSNKHSAGYLYPPLNDVLSSWKHFNLSSDTLNYRNNRAKSPMVTRELNRSDIFKTKDLIDSHSSLWVPVVLHLSCMVRSKTGQFYLRYCFCCLGCCCCCCCSCCCCSCCCQILVYFVLKKKRSICVSVCLLLRLCFDHIMLHAIKHRVKSMHTLCVVLLRSPYLSEQILGILFICDKWVDVYLLPEMTTFQRWKSVQTN